MENKYYIPNIEDLYVGYECKINDQATTKLIKDIRWHNVIITLGNFEIGEKVAINRITKLLKQGRVVVPYLTKDQIEKEGFNILKKSDNNYIYATKSNTIYNLVELRFDLGDNLLAIYNTLDSKNEIIKLPAFYGECKSINEFRKICKYLNI